MKNRIARVVIKLNLNRKFDYLIPEHLRSSVESGVQVEVPFGHSIRTGFVVEVTENSRVPGLKPIAKVLGGKSLITDSVMDLARWMSEYYVTPLEAAVHTVLPNAVRRKGATFRTMLYVRPTAKAFDKDLIEALRKRAPKQALALDILMTDDRILMRDLARAANTTQATIHTLKEKGFVNISSDTVARNPLNNAKFVRTAPLELMTQQRDALATICKSIDSLTPPVILLHGATGSGKTEVYLQAIQHGLESGRGAIVLVPEISLTPQTVERFRGRFGDNIAVLHSHLSNGERHDEWHRIRDGKANIVVGARSALFAPIHNLGLIVVDEEHETSYKQDSAPRYNARDAAVMRGHMEGVAVVLGSATPSIESYYNAKSGKYGLASMPHRVDHRKMPFMHIVDMRLKTGEENGKKTHVLSTELVEAIRNRLERSEQTILFLNRRGYSSTLICPKCGYVAKCEDCSVSMTYHKKSNNLQCHICGANRRVPARCPNQECRDPQFRYGGLGTERIEEIVMKIFPKAVVKRVDSDSMTRKDSYHRVLGDFRTGKIDILIGTQMIAKGLHFPNVTLVGVVYADVILHMPDFRASERTFQLLTQVAGRAGRGDVVGEVIVQTHTPHNVAIQAARNLTYEAFCDQEMEFRKQLFYPPYSHLICLTLKGEDEKIVISAGTSLYKTLRSKAKKMFLLSNLSPAPIARAKKNYRYQLILRTATVKKTGNMLRSILASAKWSKSVTFAIDVDAISLL